MYYQPFQRRKDIAPIRLEHTTLCVHCRLHASFGQILFTIWTNTFYHLSKNIVFALPADRNIQHCVWTADCMHPLGFIEEGEEKNWEQKIFLTSDKTQNTKVKVLWVFAFINKGAYVRQFEVVARHFQPFQWETLLHSLSERLLC